jgi:hypothetical protein
MVPPEPFKTVTEAPMMGSPFSSDTVPLISFCATAEKESPNENSRNAIK